MAKFEGTFVNQRNRVLGLEAKTYIWLACSNAASQQLE